MYNNFMLYFWLSFWLLAAIVFGVRFFRSRFGPIRTVKAVVVNKQVVESFSKFKGNGKSYRYAVTFLAEGKRLSFYVSEFSYNGYHKNESGTLTYRGDRLINFS